MEKENNRIQLPLEEIKLAFAASCIEGAARKLGVSYIEIYERMRKVDLINKFILPHYDTLHTESREYLIEDVIECLTNWEKKASHQYRLYILCRLMANLIRYAMFAFYSCTFVYYRNRF
jgi:small-conductance mechanosensitive channel